MKHHDLAVHFNKPYISRTGLIMPNRLVAEFTDEQREKAISLYYDSRARGINVFRNWLA